MRIAYTYRRTEYIKRTHRTYEKRFILTGIESTLIN
jgi:hypothetical protein